MPLVIDDGSDDDTMNTAERADALVLRHITNLGVGAATITGFRAALQLDADIVVTMDADGQHDPREITTLVQSLVDGPFDVVIGSRLLTRGDMPASRFAANLLLNAVTFLVYRKISFGFSIGIQSIHPPGCLCHGVELHQISNIFKSSGKFIERISAINRFP